MCVRLFSASKLRVYNFAVGVYQMCEVEVLAEAHSGVGFVAQPCRSALRTCGTILCDTIWVDQVSQYL